MKRSIGILLLLFLGHNHSTLLGRAVRPQPLSAKLPVPLIAQQTSMWCWAASTSMVISYFGKPVPDQCDQANSRLRRTDCCSRNTPEPCVRGGWPEFAKYGFTFVPTRNKALPWDKLVDQLANRRKPVIHSWHWLGRSGHMVVLTGFEISNGDSLLYVNDPLPVGGGRQYPMTYSRYRGAPDRTHWDDFYEISP